MPDDSTLVRGADTVSFNVSENNKILTLSARGENAEGNIRDAYAALKGARVLRSGLLPTRAAVDAVQSLIQHRPVRHGAVLWSPAKGLRTVRARAGSVADPTGFLLPEELLVPWGVLRNREHNQENNDGALESALARAVRRAVTRAETAGRETANRFARNPAHAAVKMGKRATAVEGKGIGFGIVVGGPQGGVLEAEPVANQEGEEVADEATVVRAPRKYQNPYLLLPNKTEEISDPRTYPQPVDDELFENVPQEYSSRQHTDDSVRSLEQLHEHKRMLRRPLINTAAEVDRDGIQEHVGVLDAAMAERLKKGRERLARRNKSRKQGIT